MRRLAIVPKADMDQDFTAAVAPNETPKPQPYVQQQQSQDPQWLADIKRQQQEQSGAGDLWGFPFAVR